MIPGGEEMYKKICDVNEAKFLSFVMTKTKLHHIRILSFFCHPW